jgi:hypothetical protein
MSSRISPPGVSELSRRFEDTVVSIFKSTSVEGCLENGDKSPTPGGNNLEDVVDRSYVKQPINELLMEGSFFPSCFHYKTDSQSHFSIDPHNRI